MTAYEKLTHKLAEIADLRGALSLMSWDQEVTMPAGGGQMRARQMSTLNGIQHEMFLREAGPLLEEAEKTAASMGEIEQANLRELRRDFDRAVKLPVEHVMEVSRVSSQSIQAWAVARSKNDFESFRPWLEKLIDLRIRETEYYDWKGNPYDALIDTYEPGMTTETISALFETVKPELRRMITRISGMPQVSEACLLQHLPKEAQLRWTESVVHKLGYDFTFGRQDISEHPFSISLNMEDVRITTKFTEGDVREMFYSTIHETGHALYELGLKKEYYGLPASEACSVGVHESQSRFWENNIARSPEFWECFLPSLKETFGGKLGNVSVTDVFRAVNAVQPGLIRISSDELTYHFHIILRFELENELINRRLKVSDLPEAWNARVKSYLGLDVPDNSRGVLQDIHWSMGNFGYFPTYSIGSFMAAQFRAQAEKSIPGLQDMIRRGEFAPLLAWLRTHIHGHGRVYNAQELCRRVTGETLNPQHFLDYARKKFGTVYEVDLTQ